MSRASRPRRLGPALVALACLAAHAADAQEKVGVTAAVNPATTGQPPALPVRTLFVGDDVVFNERVTTTADGQAQILFLDRSSFSVGPNSEIVIDEFVYDKNAGTGKLVASATKGVFRFVGGAISKNDGAVALKTPVATIGVRGGMFGATIAPNGALTVIKYFGNAVTITTATGSQQILRNDYFQTVDPQGNFGQSRPAPAPPSVQMAAAAPLNPPPGTTGGSTRPPTDATVQQSGVPQTNSQDVAGARAASDSRQPSLQPTPVNVASLSNSNSLQTAQQTAAVTDFDTFGQLALFIGRNVDLTPVLPLDTGGNPLNLTAITSMPISGTATFSGSALGAVNINGVTSAASGGFAMSWDFGTLTGAAALNGFGGQNFTGSLSVPSGANNIFTGTLSGSAASGPIVGGFFTNGSPAAVVHGNFQLQGPNFSGLGFFRGDRPL